MAHGNASGPIQFDFAGQWRRVRARTMRVIDVIPEDDVDWSPAPGAMTFGDLVRHLAVTERWLFVEVACGRRTRYHTHDRKLAPTLAAARELMVRLHADSLRILETLRSGDWRRPLTTPGGRAVDAWSWLQAMSEHEIHHRGQLYLMLRLRRVRTPPIFGMTSEDVQACAGRAEPE